MLIRHLFFNGLNERLAEKNDDNDVIVAKGLLRWLGYGRRTQSRPTCFAGKEFFDDIREFQKDNGLKVDGVVTPDGETAETFSKLFSEKPIDDTWGERDIDKRCAHILQNIDGPRCRHIERMQRRKARQKHITPGRECWKSAHERYAHCLAGKSLDELPPLNVWDWTGARQ